MNDFLRGAVVMACAAVGLFFLRYWRATHDRLFLLFCVAFWLLALSWTMAALHGPISPYGYTCRFLGFALIAVAVLDKNRRRSAAS